MTLPVAVLQVGWEIVPTIGAEGVIGCAKIVALPEAAEVQPLELVTVNVYVFGASPEKTAVVPELEIVAPPGVAVTVQVPDAGKPLKVTLPVATLHVGWVMVLIIRGLGVSLIVTVIAALGPSHPKRVWET